MKALKSLLAATARDLGILSFWQYLKEEKEKTKMITHEEIEEFICQYPVYQYAFFPPEEIEFSFRVRWICEKECERYNSTWPVRLLWEA